MQKQIGLKRKAKENADELMAQKTEFEKEKKALIESAAEKELELKKKLGTIGNIVHDSVPNNNDEVMLPPCIATNCISDTSNRTTMRCNAHGHPKASQSRSATSSPTTKCSPDSMATTPSAA